MRKKLPEDSNFFLSPTPSREMIMLLARGRARQELREKQKQRELQNINRPPPPQIVRLMFLSKPPPDITDTRKLLMPSCANLTKTSVRLIENFRSAEHFAGR